MTIKLSIVIVKYKSEKYLPQLLKSIGTNAGWEIIIVDNDQDNIGYGRGCNLGAKQAKGEYLLFLNADTVVTQGAIQTLIDYLDTYPKVGIVAPRLYQDAGKQIKQLSCCRFPNPLTFLIVFSPLARLFPNNLIWQNYVYTKELTEGKPLSVDAVAGAALMIRKSAFDQVGGFDPNFFFYFEENDLCRRVKQAGFTIYYLPDSEIVHFGGGSTAFGSAMSNIFNQSRDYFIAKHQSRLVRRISLTIFHFFDFITTPQGKRLLELSGIGFIVFLAAFLRLFQLEVTYGFQGELGDNLLTVKNAITARQIPLLGPPTSHPWLSFGPAYYWLLALALVVFNFNPLAAPALTIICSLIGLISSYWLIRKVAGVLPALISSLLIAVSPAFIESARSGRFMYLLVGLLPLLFYLAIKNKSQVETLLFGFLTGIALNFHLSAVLLIPSFIYSLRWTNSSVSPVSFPRDSPPLAEKWESIKLLYRFRVKPGMTRVLLVYVAGFSLTWLPFLLADSSQSFTMTRQFLLWLPYRFAGFLHLVPQNNLDSASLGNSIQAVILFFGRQFVSENPYLMVVPSIFLFLLIVVFLIARRKDTPRLLSLSIITLVIGFAGVAIHQNPPDHYFVPLLYLPIWIMVLSQNTIMSARYKNLSRFVFGGFVLVAFLINGQFYFSKRYYYLPKVAEINPWSVPYPVQYQVMSFIVADAGATCYRLNRVGPLDTYPLNYGNNYYYLGWYLGNEPKLNCLPAYTLVEDNFATIDETLFGKMIYHKDNLVVYKNVAK